MQKMDVPYLLHRYQGYLESDSRIQAIKEVFGASKYCMAITKALFDEVKGFDTSFRTSYLDVDLSLRIKSLASPMKTLYVPHIEVAVVGQHRPEDDILNGDFSQNEQIKADNKIFLERWVDKLLPEMTVSLQNSNITVSWSMDCGTGGILGFTTEAVNIIMALEGKLRMKVINDAVKCKGELAKIGFPSSVIKTIDILAHKDDRAFIGQHMAVVMHKDPGRYDATYAFNPPELLVGRSMYETDSVPQSWISHTTVVDFIWIPSEFNKQSFITGGVNSSKLEVLPELIDLTHFDPETISHKSYSTSSFQSTGLVSPDTLPNPAKFNFLSVFKWEARKNWGTLLQAFYDEFTTKEDAKNVKLYIRSNLDAEDEQQLTRWKQSYLSFKKVDESELPQVELLNRFVPYSRLPKLYKGASAYVTATHGEGWGLPIMEAMSMSLPVIATNWSGITEFTTNETALLLEATLETANNGNNGHQWAKVSVDDLRAAMRKLVDDPALCSQLGKKARQRLLDNFSADKMADRVAQLVTSHQHGFEHFKAFRRSNSGSSSYGARYNTASHTASTNTQTTNTWANPHIGTEKFGLALTKGKLTD